MHIPTLSDQRKADALKEVAEAIRRQAKEIKAELMLRAAQLEAEAKRVLDG